MEKSKKTRFGDVVEVIVWIAVALFFGYIAFFIWVGWMLPQR